jgi:predicted permease
MNELHFAFRQLSRSPGSLLTIVGLLAIGMGTSTVVFGVFDEVMLRPLAVRRPSELVRMVQHLPKMGTQSRFPYSYIETLRTSSKALANSFGETGQFLQFPMNAPEPAEYVSVHAVTPGYFEALGIPARYGRVLTADDVQTTEEPPPAVLSYHFWRRRFNADPNVVTGRTIVINKRHFAIVGVMPPGFNGITIDTGPDIRVPFSGYTQLLNFNPDLLSFEVAGRLKTGVTRDAAEAEAKTLWYSTMADYYKNVQKLPPETAAEQLSRGMALEPLEHGVSLLRDRFGPALKLLMASVGLLVIIVCTNVIGLLLARGIARQQEIAVRIALGATPAQIRGQMLSESFWIVLFGFVGALLVASMAMPLAVGMVPPIRDLSGAILPVITPDGLERRSLFFLSALTILMMLLFSIIPAFVGRSAKVSTALRTGRSSSGLAGRRVLITLQIALCTFLLAGASLFLRTVQQLKRVDPGFDQRHLATFTGDLSNSDNPARLIEELVRRVNEVPGVLFASISSRGLMRGRGLGATVAPEGVRITRTDFLNASLNQVSLKYSETIGLRIVAGRDFVPSDLPVENSREPIRVLANQTFARRFFGTSDPLGRRFGVGVEGIARGQYVIIGLVSDAKYRSIREPIPPIFYTLENKFDSFVLYVRAKARPELLLEPVRKTFAALSPELPFIETHTMADEVNDSIAIDRITAAMVSLFGSVAVLLAGAGIYGLLSYFVTQRRREFGIRMALGANPMQVGKLVVRQVLTMTIFGAILGLAAALAVSTTVRALLFGIAPNDPISFLLSTLFVTIIAAAATIIPLLRAMHTPPAETLRYEN